MKTVRKVELDGKSILSTCKWAKQFKPSCDYRVSDAVFKAVREYDRLGKVYEEKSEKILSDMSMRLLYDAIRVSSENASRKISYRDIYDFLSILLYTIEEWEKETTE